MQKNRLFSILLAVFAALGSLPLAGCSRSELSAKDPVTLTLWHVNGAQTESPFDDLVSEFNRTEGRQKGVIVRTTKITDASDIRPELLEAQAKTPGAPDMPDLFTCHAADAEALGADNLVDWNDWFPEEERDTFVDGFLEDGMVDGSLSVLPVAKSVNVLEINGTAFARFSEACGVKEGDLSTWEGFFRAADQYHEWSGGKAFCAIDYFLLTVEMNALENGAGEPEIFSGDGWYNFSGGELKDSVLSFAEEIGKGSIVVSDMYSSTQMMTGEVLCGLGSSAGILYYNDTVTYEDGTSEPMNLLILPVPHASGGRKLMAQAGLGLSAYRTTEQKAEACAVFAHWLTEADRNLELCADTGYMPVKKAAFDEINGFSFKNDAYTSLFHSLKTMYEECEPIVWTHLSGYYSHQEKFYEQIRRMQGAVTEATDPESFAESVWKLLKNV